MKYLLILIFACSFLYGQSGIRSLNGSLLNSQRLVLDTTATSNTFSLSSGIHTLGLSFTRIAFIDRANVFNNLQTMDSLLIRGKLRFLSNTSSSVGVMPMQMFADTTTQNALYYDAYLVRRTVDLTHNVLADSFRVTGTQRTALDTIVMGKRFPRAGKIVKSSYAGQYDAPSASKTFDITVWKGGITHTTGTLIDSIRYTTSGGATNQPFSLDNVIVFRTSGTSARFHSDTEMRVNGQVILSDSHTGTMDTESAINYIYIVVTMNAASSWFQLDRGWTETKN